MPEVPSGNRNLLKNSKVFKGTGINGSGRILDETYQGCTVRYYAGGNYCDIAQFSNCVVPKVGSTYVASFWAKGSGKVRTYFYGNPNYLQVLSGTSNQNVATSAGDGSIDFTLTEDWQRYWVVYKLKSSFPTNDTTVAKHLLFRHLTSGVDTDEVYLAGVQLEEGNIAAPYSLAPEDFGWSITALVPTQSQRYLWKFEYIYYSDGSVEVTSPINISIAGADGTNGQTSHVHFAFADNATGGGFSLTTPKTYMGWYADFNETASNDPTKYKWTKVEGPKGAPGGKGDDGKTSYFHLAYASSADGKTGFSFTESGQQYQGYYTDFTQTSSTDPTKYTWMDRRAGIEVGSKNLLRKTAVNTENLKLFGTNNATISVVEKDGHQTYKIKVGSTQQNNSGANFSGNDNYYNLVKDRYYTFSYWIWTSADKQLNLYKLGHIQACNYHDDKVGSDSVHQHTTPVYSTDKILAEQWTKVWYTFKATSNSYFKPFFWYLDADDEIYIYDMMLNEGTIPLSHSLAPEDAQEQIDSKADQALTQQQLNALAEQNSIVKAEMEAKASIDTVNQWITAYQNYVTANDEARAESEKNLQEAAARILQLKTDVGALRQQWDFIDTYMSIQNEGLIIGKSDGSAFAKFANDRISLFSGSSEVMYISQGTLHIENGIFTKTIQIGRFRFETHPADADMLVLRYLGG